MAAFDRGQVSFSSFDMFFRGENNQSLRKVFICIRGMLVSLRVRQPPKKKHLCLKRTAFIGVSVADI